MSTYLARLGAFSFSIGTAAFQELQRASEYRWEAKNRIGRKPAQQNVGSGADTIRLSGTIYPHTGPGASHMGVLRGIAAAGEPVPLIYGFERSGQYCGRWCITHIEETRTVFFSNGAPRRIDFSLSLVEYGEDGGTALAVPVAATLAAASVTTVDLSAALAVGSRAEAIAASVSNETQALSSIGDLVASARDVADTVTTAIKGVMSSDVVCLAKESVNEFNKLKDSYRAMDGAIKSVAGVIDNPSTAAAALGNLEASAGGLADVFSSASTKIQARTGVVAGGSTASLHDQQVQSVVAVTGAMSRAVTSIASAATQLKGHF